MNAFLSFKSNFIREAGFLFKQKHVLVFITIAFFLSCFSIWSGIHEVKNQQVTIDRLLVKDIANRKEVLADKKDYGGAAYYSFHLTYSEPSALAFTSLGQRDIYPWKHRIRMLALEGQVYEDDAGNSELSLLGRFDFSFLVSVLVPLFMILLLHDLRTSECEAERYDLLLITSHKSHLWFTRAFVLCLTLTVAILVPFVVGVLLMSPYWLDTLSMMGLVCFSSFFWLLLIFFLVNLKCLSSFNSPSLASVLLGFWLLLAVIIPVVSDQVITSLVSSPKGGDIVLTQREAVNDAWDLPVEDTWNAFLLSHPEWKGKTQMSSLFEWKWYYAFQQVGDEKAAQLSRDYRQAIIERSNLGNIFSWLSPTMLTQRYMEKLAATDVATMLDYEQKVRDFHAALRDFFYPLLFDEVEFSRDKLDNTPTFFSFNSGDEN